MNNQHLSHPRLTLPIPNWVLSVEGQVGCWFLHIEQFSQGSLWSCRAHHSSPVHTAIFIFPLCVLTRYSYTYRHMHLYSPQIMENSHLPMLYIRQTALHLSIHRHTYKFIYIYTQVADCSPHVYIGMHAHRCRDMLNTAVTKERERWP